MGRHKIISDDDVLTAARSVFREQGHAASTREIARVAGVSEAVLYQRFGNKDTLFFAAMVPSAPDLQKLLGPEDPPEDARAYLVVVVERMASYFAEILPLALQVMTHPSFEIAAFAKAHPAGATVRLQDELAKRIRILVQRRRIMNAPSAVVARLLVSLAHDWALQDVLSSKVPPAAHRELAAMIDVAWRGLAPHARSRAAPAAHRSALADGAGARRSRR